ncbi:hypothetical protein TSAR_014743 [Trichomalopsis sarcophagae]|uniref:Uncharacterized protein n=1 Tax=Trichomalopsis sarcophagae TaxID=543379 RepID=A0A232EDB8_9HYME|nr:hypothetical protein TSAR_014743 [Trichomalopsis sarcophagae]
MEGVKEMEKKTLREVIQKKKQEERENKWKKLEESEGMSKFWEAINHFRQKPVQKDKERTGIRKQDWVDHLKKLLGTKQEGRWERLYYEGGREGQRG